MKKILLQISLTLLSLFFISNVVAQTFDIYVSDAGDFQTLSFFKVFKYDENGENPEVFIDNQLAWPQDILFLEDQEVVLISSLNSGRITKHDATTGDFIADFATGISGPTRMKIGADNLLYVLQWQGDGKVKRYQLDGTFVDDFTSVGVNQSIGLDWDTDGNLYVSTYGGNKVRKFDPDGNDLGFFIESNLQGPTNIWFNENGELLANNWNGTAAKRFDTDGNFVDNFITGLSNPEGVGFYPNGNIIIGNGGTGAVKLFDSQGNFIEDIVSSGAGGLTFPNAVVLRAQSTVSVAQLESETKFVQPTLGSVFYLKGLDTSNIRTVEIYDTLGNLVTKQATTGNLLWEAGNVPEGTYIIRVRASNEKLFSQKVVVKR